MVMTVGAKSYIEWNHMGGRQRCAVFEMSSKPRYAKCGRAIPRRFRRGGVPGRGSRRSISRSSTYGEKAIMKFSGKRLNGENRAKNEKQQFHWNLHVIRSREQVMLDGRGTGGAGR